MSPFEPHSLSADEVGRLPGLALDLLRRSWLKLIGFIIALAVLGEWSNAPGGGAVALILTFAAGGLIMALGFWTARAADRCESLITAQCGRVLGRGACLGLLLAAVYLAWGLPTGPSTPTIDESPVAASFASASSHPVTTIPETLRASRPDNESTVLSSGLAFARERAAWISLAAALGTLLVVVAHVFGNGLAGGLVFVPVYVLGIPLSRSMFLSGRAASRNRAFMRLIFRRSPGVIIGLNVIVALVVLAPDLLALIAPLVTLYVLYIGSLSYVTYRAIFEGRSHNKPRRARSAHTAGARWAAMGPVSSRRSSHASAQEGVQPH